MGDEDDKDNDSNHDELLECVSLCLGQCFGHRCGDGIHLVPGNSVVRHDTAPLSFSGGAKNPAEFATCFSQLAFFVVT